MRTARNPNHRKNFSIEGYKDQAFNRSIEALEEVNFKFFRNLWDSINKKRGYGWDKNPWVWVVEFKRITSIESKLQQ